MKNLVYLLNIPGSSAECKRIIVANGKSWNAAKRDGIFPVAAGGPYVGNGETKSMAIFIWESRFGDYAEISREEADRLLGNQ